MATCPGRDPPKAALCVQGLMLGAGSPVGRAALGTPSRCRRTCACVLSPEAAVFSQKQRGMVREAAALNPRDPQLGGQEPRGRPSASLRPRPPSPPHLLGGNPKLP